MNNEQDTYVYEDILAAAEDIGIAKEAELGRIALRYLNAMAFDDKNEMKKLTPLFMAGAINVMTLRSLICTLIKITGAETDADD